MSKFLKLVQENTPGEEAGRGPYTVVYKDSQGNVMAKVTVPDSVSAWWHHFSEFIKNSGGYDLEVEKGPTQPVEDNEHDEAAKENIDDSVYGLAAKKKRGLVGLAGSALAKLGVSGNVGKAHKAVKERNRLNRDRIRVFQKQTKKGEEQLQKALAER